MPLYEYYCDSCEETFEEIRSASDDDEVKCPTCDKPAQKKLSAFSMGSGSGGSSVCSPGSGGSWGGG